MDYSVRDSSIWRNDEDMSAVNINDGTIRVGIVRDRLKTVDGNIRYSVEVFKDGNSILMSCQLMNKWGGVYNFEEQTIRPYLSNNGALPPNVPVMYGDYATRAGDTVVVAALGGDPREGIILGGIKHAARKSELTEEEIVYHSRFNGVEEEIRADGTWKFTWNGIPINEDLLDQPPLGQPIVEPQFNTLQGTSFMGFDNTGGFTVTDDNGNSIFIKKETGNISLVSNDHRIEIGTTDLAGDGVAIKTELLAVGASDVSVQATGAIKMQGVGGVSINGTTIAIGNDAVELLATLTELIDALGAVAPISPVGNCTPLQATPQWAQVIPLQLKIKTLTGSVEQAEILSPLVIDQDNFSTTT